MKWKYLLYPGCKTVSWSCVKYVRRTSSNCSTPFSILFFGTDHFALPTLRALHKERLSSSTVPPVVNSLHVVSTSNQSPVAKYAISQDIPMFPWPLKDVHDQFDVGVLVSFGRMVPGRVISMFPLGILNVHPSLLPRWRGASPVQHTVLNGDPETAVSIISIQPQQFDTGPLLKQRCLCVPKSWTAAQLSSHLAGEGAVLLMETLQNMPGILAKSWAQSSSGVTYAHKPLPHMSNVNWEEHTVEQIPLRTSWNGETLRLMDMIWKQESLANPLDYESSHKGKSQKVTSKSPEHPKLHEEVNMKDTEVSCTSLKGNIPQLCAHVDPVSSVHMVGVDTADIKFAGTCGGVSVCSEWLHEEQDMSREPVAPGTVTFSRNLRAICVKCRNGWVAFHTVVYKKTMTAEDFHNGYMSKGKRKHVQFQSLLNGLFSQEYWNFVQKSKAKS